MLCTKISCFFFSLKIHVLTLISPFFFYLLCLNITLEVLIDSLTLRVFFFCNLPYYHFLFLNRSYIKNKLKHSLRTFQNFILPIGKSLCSLIHSSMTVKSSPYLLSQAFCHFDPPFANSTLNLFLPFLSQGVYNLNPLNFCFIFV